MQPTSSLPQQQPTAAPTQDEKTMGMIVHFGSIVAGFLAPLIVYLLKKDESKYVAFHALQALFFALACMVVMIVTAPILIGFLVWPVQAIFNLIAGIKVAGGGDFEYPVVGKIARKQVFGA